MTCYMLPGNMQISEHKGQRKFEKVIYMILPIYSLSMKPGRCFLKWLLPRLPLAKKGIE